MQAADARSECTVIAARMQTGPCAKLQDATMVSWNWFFEVEFFLFLFFPVAAAVFALSFFSRLPFPSLHPSPKTKETTTTRMLLLPPPPPLSSFSQ